MTDTSSIPRPTIPAWHRSLLAAAALFTVLLIAMGGVLCVTHSIRSCPDWPGCFGRIVPPLETSPILEFTHRLLAAISGFLILGAAVAGLARPPHLRWIAIPPLVAGVLLVVVSYFGAQVVLRGLAAGWAAVDVGSALLVVASMVAAATFAHAHGLHPDQPDRLAYRDPFARLVLATTGVVFGILVSAVLVAGKNSLTGCLGWPIYSGRLFEVDVPGAGKVLRLALSGVGVLLMAAIMVEAWRPRQQRLARYQAARWLGIVFLLEILLQGLLLAFGFQTGLLVPYTVVGAVFWGLLAYLAVLTGLL